MMYEDTPRRGFCLELNDEKKRVNSSKAADLLTNNDLGMLGLTSPELERIILDPTNDRFMGSGRTAGFQNDSFRQQHQQQQQQQQQHQQQQQQQQRGQPGHGVIARDQQHESQRSFDSSMDQRYHQPNLPALDAFVSSDEESDTETSNNAYITLESQQSKTGFTNNSYFNADSKPMTLHPMLNSAVTSVATGGYNTPTSRTGTHYPTAANPGESYLPFGVLHSLPIRPKEEPMQLVPCMDGSPAPSLPPMSPINMDEQERVKQERKRERNRMAARKCRTKKLEQIMVLEGRVKDLKEQNRSLGDTATALRALMHRLQSQISQHISCGCPMMTTTTTTTAMTNSSSSLLSFDPQ